MTDQASAPLPATPVWNRVSGELWFRGELQHAFGKKRSSNPPLLLDAFQNAGWCERLPDPLLGSAMPTSRTSDRLSNAIKNLNRVLRGRQLHFFLCDQGTGITWLEVLVPA